MMANDTLDAWVGNGWLHGHETSGEEVANLNAIVERELRDSAIDRLSLDARLGMLYNAGIGRNAESLIQVGIRSDPHLVGALQLVRQPLLIR